MRRAIELAGLGLGEVSPNPLVGCVVVHDDQIIGEGWHRKFGGPHAEVNALNDVSDASKLLSATVYVNLEPCSHFGKTPPCADLLVEKNVKRVVIANRDTNSLVAGQGIAKLLSAGIEVTENVLHKEAHWLNRRFFANQSEGIPYVILKWAESDDGRMSGPGPQQKWISNPYSRQRVHQWRAQEDAVLIGSRTAELDNPVLNVRDWSGRNPVRVVLDPSLRLPDTLHVFDQSQATVRYNLLRDQRRPNLDLVKVDGKDIIPAVLKDLLDRNIGSVIVEGGAQTLAHCISGGWWHEARILRSSKAIGEGIKAPLIQGDRVEEDDISGDHLSVLTNPKRFRNE